MEARSCTTLVDFDRVGDLDVFDAGVISVEQVNNFCADILKLLNPTDRTQGATETGQAGPVAVQDLLCDDEVSILEVGRPTARVDDSLRRVNPVPIIRSTAALAVCLVKNDYNRWTLFDSIERQQETITRDMDGPCVETNPRVEAMSEVVRCWVATRTRTIANIKTRIGNKAGFGLGFAGTGLALALTSGFGIWVGGILLGGSAAHWLWKIRLGDRKDDGDVGDLVAAVSRWYELTQ